MSNHIEWGEASSARYTLKPSAEALQSLRAVDEPDTSAPWVLGLWNGNRDGLALQGTPSQLITYLERVLDDVKRRTDPKRVELDNALKRLSDLRAERAAVLDSPVYATYPSRVDRLDEDITDALIDLADAAAALNNAL